MILKEEGGPSFIPDTVANLSKCFELPINQSIMKIGKDAPLDTATIISCEGLCWINFQQTGHDLSAQFWCPG